MAIRPKPKLVALLIIAVLTALLPGTCPARAQATAPSPPPETLKLIFIHHSCGENWLSDEDGGLGRALDQNNYFVSDTNYGWGPRSIGDRTDITDWPEWFTGPDSGRYLAALYAESGQNSWYTRTRADPGGENQIIMFKSCYPNSELEGSPHDPPTRGEGLTVGNAKAIYNELLTTFATQEDKLFVAITAPPVQDPSYAANARAFNTWLVQDWLAGYPSTNVAVWDFYNVLTHPDNHHRIRDGDLDYTTDRGGDTLHYATGDNHPSQAGNAKATGEFVPVLNSFVHRWQGSASKPPDAEAATDTPPAPELAATAAQALTPPPATEAPSDGVETVVPTITAPQGALPAPTEPNAGTSERGLCPGGIGLGLVTLLGGIWVQRRSR